jgi:hypothetical protein
MKVGNLVRNKGHVKRGFFAIVGVVVESSDELQIARVRWSDPLWLHESFMYRWKVLEILSEVKKHESK